MKGPIRLNALDHHFAGFVNGLDSAPCPELWLAAAMASAATGQGNVCLDLEEAGGALVVPFHTGGDTMCAPVMGQWLEALAPCDTVGRPGEYTPLVLDAAGRLYLQRLWEYERRVADGILARVATTPLDRDRLGGDLARYFPTRAERPDWQRAAALAAVSRRFTVISGGPGTGKTSTVARILALLIGQAGDRDLRIALTAPTGKAALRLRQSILQNCERLELGDTIRSRMPDSVQTIHRLLGVVSGRTSCIHNRKNPLPCDVLVVDEGSMVDLPLMARLMDALRDDARMILLGDRDQLASVEAGAVLADICNHGMPAPFSAGFRALLEDWCGPMPPEMAGDSQASTGAPLADAVIHLRTSYRFSRDSGIGTLSRLINNGDGAAALDLLLSGGHPDLVWRPLPPAGAFKAAFTAVVQEGYDAYLGAGSPETALEALDGFRVLSPYREGMYGVENLNRMAENALGLKRAAGDPPCHRLPVMVTVNNYELGLFNGDTGVVMAAGPDGHPAAFFPDAEKGVRHLSSLRLPPFESAFALSVHKSQGSEFDRLLLILPERASEALSRELLYTAVTRARRTVEIWGTEEAFLRAVAQRIVRRSGLRDRLWPASVPGTSGATMAGGTD